MKYKELYVSLAIAIVVICTGLFFGYSVFGMQHISPGFLLAYSLMLLIVGACLGVQYARYVIADLIRQEFFRKIEDDYDEDKSMFNAPKQSPTNSRIVKRG